MRSFEGKKVLVTGGSSGIGFATADLLSRNGASVMLAARNGIKLEEASKRIRGEVNTYAVDISDPGSVGNLSGSITGDHGNIDILINSAGIVHPGRLEDLTWEQIRSQIEINLLGTINVTRSLLPAISSGGAIVNISSAAGFVGIYGYTAYSASKFGVVGFSEALRMELMERDISVSVVFPPDTDTPQLEFENRTKPEELEAISGKIKPISPEKVASSVMKGIRSGEFLIFPDSGSRSTYIASRMAGSAMRSWMDRKIRRSRKE